MPTGNDFYVLYMLNELASNNGTVDISLRRLAEICGIDKNTVSNAIKRLEMMGYIKCYRYSGKLPNEYEIKGGEQCSKLPTFSTGSNNDS